MDNVGTEYMIITTRAGMDDQSSSVPGFGNCLFEDGIPVVMDPEGVYEEPIGISSTVAAQIVAFGPDLMHVTSPGLGVLGILRWCRQNNVRTVATYHSAFDDYAKHYMPELRPRFLPRCLFDTFVMWGVNMYFQTIYNSISTIFVPTPYIQNKLSANGSVQQGVNRSEVWGRAVDAEMFHPRKRSSAFRRKHSIPDAAVVVLWAGRMVPEKGMNIWLDVLAQLQQATDVQVIGVACGKGPGVDQMRALPYIRALGWLDTEALAEAYASSDIFLFPSAVETFGNVTLEAKASGVACIVEATCSSHLIQHGVNGFCCNRPETFFESTLQLVTDQALRGQFGARSRKEVATNNNLTVHNQAMLDNYQRVIDSRCVAHSIPTHTLWLGSFFEFFMTCLGSVLRFCLLLGAHRDGLAIKVVALGVWICLTILMLPFAVAVGGLLAGTSFLCTALATNLPTLLRETKASLMSAVGSRRISTEPKTGIRREERIAATTCTTAIDVS